MTKFVKKKVVQETADEDILFATLGAAKPGQDKKKSYIIEVNKPVEGVVTKIKEINGSNYKYLIYLDIEGVDKPVLFLGWTDLLNQMGLGKFAVEDGVPVAEGDYVQITYLGKKKCQNSNFKFHAFEVGVAEA